MPISFLDPSMSLKRSAGLPAFTQGEYLERLYFPVSGLGVCSFLSALLKTILAILRFLMLLFFVGIEISRSAAIESATEPVKTGSR